MPPACAADQMGTMLSPCSPRIVAVTWVAGRVLAVSVAAAGWALLPAAHRALLARVSLRAAPDR